MTDPQHQQHVQQQQEISEALRIIRRMIRVRRQYLGAGTFRGIQRIPKQTGK